MSSTPATLTVTLVDGTQVVVPDSLEQITPYVLQEQGDWFEDEIKVLRRLVQPGQTVIDIGANVGVYALSLARTVGPTGQVWAFEPASDTAALLEASIAVNGTPWLHLQRQALSDHSGSAWLQTPGQSELNSLASAQQGPGEEVSLTTLDACLDAFGWQQVDLLKIDAEGEEERILAGGQRFFAELSPLVMFELKAGSELHLELVERFQALGYGCYRLVPGLDALMPFDPADGVDGYLLNLFAAKPDRAKTLAAGGWLVPTARPEPPDAAELEPYHWSRVLVQLPYGKALAGAWAAEERRADHDVNNTALALWACSQDPAEPVQKRLGALNKSYHLLCQICRPSCPPSRWSSLARVAQALGERLHAVRALGHLLPHFEDGQSLSFSEPFLPPLSSHDGLDPGKCMAAWLEAAAWETEELLSSFSGFFTGQDALARLQRIQALGFSSAQVVRRLELVNRRIPLAPPATPAMERACPEQISLSRQAWEWIEGGHWEQAKGAVAEALTMGDCCSEALYYIGKSLFKLGEAYRAVFLLQRAVELAPENPTYLLDLGVHLKSLGQVQAGDAVVQQAIFLYGFMAASNKLTAKDLANLGIAYDDLGDTENALASLDQALALDPKLISAKRRKASILNRTNDRKSEALEIWSDLLNEDPNDVGLLLYVAGAKADDGELQAARDLLDKALELAPDYPLTYMKMAWVTSISGKPGMADHLRYLKAFWQLIKEQYPEDKRSEPVVYALPASTETIRVGILSAEVGDHVVGLFLEPFLRHYDRSKLTVELIQTKEIRSRFADLLRARGDAVLSVDNLSIPAARKRIRSRSYHVILETSGFTRNTGISILARRCAPVQCHYIGFHASTGLDTIDWFIGDDLTAAQDLQDQYVERLWRLPRPWLACRLDPDLPEASSVLQDEPPVLGSFNQFGKSVSKHYPSGQQLYVGYPKHPFTSKASQQALMLPCIGFGNLWQQQVSTRQG